MEKRVPTRVGNVYCVEIDKCYKRYFQFICKDRTCLNGNVIRIFKKKYKLNEEPNMEDIVSGEIAYYIETFIYGGLYFNAWYYVGKSKNIGLEETENFWFATKFYNNTKKITDENLKYADLESWDRELWKINRPKLLVPELPNNKNYRLYPGCVHPYFTIVEVMKLGYYKSSDYVFDTIKRIPFDDVDSYTMRKTEDEIMYYHFTGENLMGIVIVDNATGRKSIIERDNLPPAFYKLKFGDINWKSEQFISEEDYKNIAE